MKSTYLTNIFLWLFKVVGLVLRLKCSYQDQTSLYYYGTSVRTHFLMSTGTQVTCNIRCPPSFGMLRRIRSDRSRGAMKGADLAKGDSWLQNTLRTKNPPPSAYKRCFTSHAGSGPKSTLQYVLLALCLSIQTTAENT